MNSLTIPPTPSWFLDGVVNINSDGVLAYGARHEVVILKCINKDDFSPHNIDVSFLPIAHKERINGVIFSPSNAADCFKNALVTCGDDGLVKLWDLNTNELKLVNSGHQDGQKVVGVDWSKADPGLVVSVSDASLLICWDLHSNKLRRLQIGSKINPICIAACPHDKRLAAVGAKNGLILVINLKGQGKVHCRMRSHEADVVSLSWCPESYNIFQNKSNITMKKNGLQKKGKSNGVTETNGVNTESGDTENEELSKEINENVFLLASGSKDRTIYFWRAGTDGRYETFINLPTQPLTSGYRPKLCAGEKGGQPATWIAVNWIDPYTLLSSSLFGELLEWDLQSTNLIKDKQGNTKKLQQIKPKLLHGKHHKGLYAITCQALKSRPPNNKEERYVWTTALDRKLVCTSLRTNEIKTEIPTIGGIVYCATISPLDPNRIAFGFGDSRVFIWNMGVTKSWDISVYWQKINSKVMALEWHPTEENWLAFGTGEGRVGLFDISTMKAPILFRQHIRRCVYRLCWAPHFVKPEKEPAGKYSLALYAVGDGEVIQMSVDAADKESVILNDIFKKVDLSCGFTKSLGRSDFVWKSDRSVAALGNENGVIYILDGTTLEKKHVVYAHKKLVQCITWHPATVTSDAVGMSPYQNWLASASDSVVVYDVKPDSSEQVAVFNLHTEKVVSMAWSPHFNGQLVSVSYDYTAQLWDVINRVPLVNFNKHHNSVVCGLWSPLDVDYIITGSADNTIRVWKVSDQPNNRPIEKKKNKLINRLKKRANALEATDVVRDTVQSITSSAAPAVQSKPSEPEFSKDWDTGHRPKSKSIFPGCAASLSLSRHLPEYYKIWQENKQKANAKSENGTSQMEIVNGNISLSSQPPASQNKELGYLDFFSDGKAMRNLLLKEEMQLSELGHIQQLYQCKLWRGDIAEVIEEAMRKKKLTDWLVSLAPMASFRIWQDACVVYSEQLANLGEYMKAASYLIAVHKIEEAVQLLADQKLFREALALAKSRMPSDDPLVKSVMTEYAQHSLNNGMINLAAHCFLSLDEPLTACNVLARCKDLKSLKLAALFAREAKSYELANNLAKDSFSIALMADDFETCSEIIENHPDLKHLSLWANTKKNISPSVKQKFSSQIAWLQGSKMAGGESYSIVEKIRQEAKDFDSCYQTLKKNVNCLSNHHMEKQLWLYVSCQLSLAGAADCNLVTLQHLVQAVSGTYRYQTLNNTKEPLFNLCMLLSPKGPLAGGSLFRLQDTMECTNEEKNLLSSLNGFLLAGIVGWLGENIELVKENLKDVESKTLDWLKSLLSSYMSDLFHSRNVEYFKNETMIINLQQKIASSRCSSVSSEKREGRVILTATRTKKQKPSTEKGAGDSKEISKSDKRNSDSTDTDSTSLKSESSDIIEIDREMSGLKIDKETIDSSQDIALNSLEIIKDVKIVEPASKLVNNDAVDVKRDNNDTSRSYLQITEEQKNIKIDNEKESNSLGEPKSNSNESDVDSLCRLKEFKKMFESDRISAPNPFASFCEMKNIVHLLLKDDNPELFNVLDNDIKDLWEKANHSLTEKAT